MCDHETGRFILQDSIDFIVSNHLTGLNLYAYCNNSPVMYSDPHGTIAPIVALIAIGAVVGLVLGAITSGITYVTTEEFTWRGFGAAVASALDG